MLELFYLLSAISFGLNIVLGLVVYSRNQVIFNLKSTKNNISKFADNSFDHLCKAVNEAESLRKMNTELSAKNFEPETEDKKKLLTIQSANLYIEGAKQKIQNLEENMNLMNQIEEENKYCHQEINKLNKKIERILDTLTNNPLVNMGSIQCGYLLDLIKLHIKEKRDKQNALQKASEVRIIRAHVGE